MGQSYITFNEDGTIKKGIRLNWILTKNYKRNLLKLKDAYRRKSVYVKETHCNLANEILSLGDNIYTETMNFKALAKKSTKPVELNEKTGKNKRKPRCYLATTVKYRQSRDVANVPSIFLWEKQNSINIQTDAFQNFDTY